MSIKFELKNGSLSCQWNDSSATIDVSSLFICHMGCKLLGTLKIPQHLVLKWKEEFGHNDWKKTNDSKLKLSKSITQAITMSATEGAVLWDTMRLGSDYWRSGNLLSETIQLTDYSTTISFYKEDVLTPPKDLLESFKDNVHMSFGQYAEAYSKYLQEYIPIAMASVIFDLSKNRLPILYCIDPYIPSYGNRHQCFCNTPYDERDWLDELRIDGCHRVVLVEEIAPRFLKLGVDVKILEIDQSFSTVHSRHMLSKIESS